MPFEDIVGQHPTLEDMQEAVVSNKLRPALKPSWHQHGVSVSFKNSKRFQQLVFADLVCAQRVCPETRQGWWIYTLKIAL